MKENKRGITLIALIISIIVMLILVGVTVTVAINGGLFEKAREGTKGTTIARVKEQIIGDITAKIADKLGENITEAELISIIENGEYGEVNGDDKTVTIEGESIKLEDIWEYDVKYRLNFVYGSIAKQKDKFEESAQSNYDFDEDAQIYILDWYSINNQITGSTEQEKLNTLKTLEDVNKYISLSPDQYGWEEQEIALVLKRDNNDETSGEIRYLEDIGESIKDGGQAFGNWHVNSDGERIFCNLFGYGADDLEIPIFFSDNAKKMYLILVDPG